MSLLAARRTRWGRASAIVMKIRATISRRNGTSAVRTRREPFGAASASDEKRNDANVNHAELAACTVVSLALFNHDAAIMRR